MSILVYAENREGKFRKPVFELVSYASALGKMMNCGVTALSVGNVPAGEIEKLGHYGATVVLTVNGDSHAVFDTGSYASLLAEVAQSVQAGVILIAGNTTGKALAPGVAIRLKAGVAAGVAGLPLSVSPFTVNKRVYSGNAYARVVIKSAVKVITLLPNSFDTAESKVSPSISAYTPKAAVAVKTEVLNVQKQDGRVLLTEASVVVSGGRGMKSADNWGPLVELAELLDGATACSRPVSDEGWRPHEEHTGQTGKIIAPDLYIAVGISGATQHLAGVSSSKYIVAINSDKSAPIFEAAQYGIAGDAAKVLPKLVEALKAAKGK
ncbi:MAG: electron transfer flavoprotein subunit alpha/FixB family protein [Bacteroidetes bacterium]|nr:electron transfer flavoprotein subunit alpha/FixB family protein [Bacteroidota bacterium]